MSLALLYCQSSAKNPSRINAHGNWNNPAPKRVHRLSRWYMKDNGVTYFQRICPRYSVQADWLDPLVTVFSIESHCRPQLVPSLANIVPVINVSQATLHRRQPKGPLQQGRSTLWPNLWHSARPPVCMGGLTFPELLGLAKCSGWSSS